MAGLSSRALRIYDEAGLLPPAAVDDATGYRVDRHWRTLATRLGAVRQVIEALHRLVDGDDPGEVDTVDVQAIVIYVLDMRGRGGSTRNDSGCPWCTSTTAGTGTRWGPAGCCCTRARAASPVLPAESSVWDWSCPSASTVSMHWSTASPVTAYR